MLALLSAVWMPGRFERRVVKGGWEGAHGCKWQQQNLRRFPKRTMFLAVKFPATSRGGRRGPGGGRVVERRGLSPTRGADGNNTRPLHRPGGEDAPPDPRLLLPGASGRPRSAKSPVRPRARVRASARLGPPDPSRAVAAPTHIPRRRGPGLSRRRGTSSSPGRAASPGPTAEPRRRRRELLSERSACPAVSAPGGR